MREMKSPIHKMLRGAAAGTVATLPMTIFMLTSWLQLPNRELNPLPPRRITRRFLRESGLRPHMSEPKEQTLTWLLHFLFGAAAGSLYGILDEKIPGRDAVKGTLAGMAVWSGSYLGWIPALGILPPATRHPWRMNVLMIAAHFVWGISLGLLTRMFKSRRQYINL